MHITQKEFVQAMVENETVFFGNTRDIVTIEEVASAIAKYFALEEKPAKRKCVARSKYLEFGDNRSRLDFAGCDCGKYEFEQGNAYYCADSWVVCWYFVEK